MTESNVDDPIQIAFTRLLLYPPPHNARKPPLDIAGAASTSTPRPFTSQKQAIKFCHLPSAICHLPSLSLSLSLISLVILSGLIWPAALFGQVTIKERVVISPVDSQQVSFTAGLTTSDTLTVPFDGILVVRYDSAKALDSAIGFNAELVVTRNGQNFAVDQVASHLGPSAQSTYFCSDPEVIFGDWYLYYPGFGPVSKSGQFQSEDSLWTVGQVFEGDRIAFDYDGKRQGFTYQTGAQSDSTWLGGALGCSDPPQTYLEDAIWFTVMIQPDTLTIDFITAPNDTLPEPGTLITARAIVKGANGEGSVRFEIENHDYPGGDPDTLIWFLVGNDTLAGPQDVTMNVDTAEVTLVSTTYWGAVDVTAKYFSGSDTLHEKTKRWPEDEDGDGIADRWEMANGGFLHLDSLRSDPSCPITGADTCWDADFSSGSPSHGDGLSKLAEYQGVLVGDKHERLDPNAKEVFLAFDSGFDSADVDSVVAKVESQLDIRVRLVGGYTSFGVATGYGDPDSMLTWLGNELRFAYPSRNVVVIEKAGTRHEAPQNAGQYIQNGIFVKFGIYSVSGLYAGSADCRANLQDCRRVKIPNLKPQPNFGQAGSPLFENGMGTAVRIWDGFTANIHQGNSIPENVTHKFVFNIVGTGGLIRPWYAQYANRDMDGSGGAPGDEINPFDVLSASKYLNDEPPDGIVASLSEATRVRYTMLHEIGHSLGMYAGPRCREPNPDCHPTSGNSVMRPGMGPGKSFGFKAPDDVKAMRFK